jgi:uncharacterized protein (TIGR02246 family)
MAPTEIERLYRNLLEAWNRRDAAAFAALFRPDGHSIGFDGSEMHGPAEIESALAGIFAHHPTAAYVALVRDVTFATEEVAILRAHVGMVPAGQTDLEPDVNAVQVVVAARVNGEWRIQLLQNTPAAYHGRPQAGEQLTHELRQQLQPKRW